jgi:hypothetical protein
MDREQAIAWLRSVGRNAHARDWSFGKTIAITVGEPNAADEIKLYPGIVYLYPTDTSAWNLLDLELSDPAARYEDLESAARGVHEYVARKEAALRPTRP